MVEVRATRLGSRGRIFGLRLRVSYVWAGVWAYSQEVSVRAGVSYSGQVAEDQEVLVRILG